MLQIKQYFSFFLINASLTYIILHFATGIYVAYMKVRICIVFKRKYLELMVETLQICFWEEGGGGKFHIGIKVYHGGTTLGKSQRCI